MEIGIMSLEIGLMSLEMESVILGMVLMSLEMGVMSLEMGLMSLEMGLMSVEVVSVSLEMGGSREGGAELWAVSLRARPHRDVPNTLRSATYALQKEVHARSKRM